MKKITSNRVVLALHIVLVVCGAAVTAIAAATNSLPHAWAPDVAYLAVFLGVIGSVTAATLKYLDGSQQVDALEAHRANVGQLSVESAAPQYQSVQPSGAAMLAAPQYQSVQPCSPMEEAFAYPNVADIPHGLAPDPEVPAPPPAPATEVPTSEPGAAA